MSTLFSYNNIKINMPVTYIQIIAILSCVLNCSKCMKLNVNGAFQAFITNKSTLNDVELTKSYLDETTRKDKVDTKYPKAEKVIAIGAQDKGKEIATYSESDESSMNVELKAKYKFEDVKEFNEQVYAESVKLLKYLGNDKFSPGVNRALRKGVKTSRLDNGMIHINRKPCKGQECFFEIADSANKILKSMIRSKVDKTGKSSWMKTIDIVRSHHYDHICKKYKICRSQNDYSSNIKDIVSEVGMMRSQSLKMFFSTLAEVVHRAKIGSIMSPNQVERFKYNLVLISAESPVALSARVKLIQSMFTKEGKELVAPVDYRLSMGLYKIYLEALEKSASPTAADEFTEFTASLGKWRAMENGDLKAIIDKFVKFVTNNIETWDEDSKNKFITTVTYLMGNSSEEMTKETIE